MAEFNRKFPVIMIFAWLGWSGCGAGESAGDSVVDHGPDVVEDEGEPDAAHDPGQDTVQDFPAFEPTDVEEEACVATEVQASNAYAPVDIIWAVDSSGSMDYENHVVQDNLNRFSTSISASGIDHHVILIGDGDQMSVPPPLGGSEYFMHINDKVDSNEALIKMVGHYPDYQAFLRPGAVRHFVAVTDDESDMSADEFIARVASFTDPGFPDGFTFHSIVAFGSIPYIGCVTGARIGWQYLDLSARTGGVVQSICQTDWSPIFAALETAIGVVTELPCVFDIPEPPEEETLEPNKVNVVYTSSDGAETVIPMVTDPGSCGSLGWYYDSPDSPAQVIVCPDTCTMLQADAEGRVNIAFGCATVII